MSFVNSYIQEDRSLPWQMLQFKIQNKAEYSRRREGRGGRGRINRETNEHLANVFLEQQLQGTEWGGCQTFSYLCCSDPVPRWHNPSGSSFPGKRLAIESANIFTDPSWHKKIQGLQSWGTVLYVVYLGCGEDFSVTQATAPQAPHTMETQQGPWGVSPLKSGVLLAQKRHAALPLSSKCYTEPDCRTNPVGCHLSTSALEISYYKLLGYPVMLNGIVDKCLHR